MMTQSKQTLQKKEKVEQIKKALKDEKCPVLNMAFKEMFHINVSDTSALQGKTGSGGNGTCCPNNGRRLSDGTFQHIRLLTGM